jgi:hypothetical protein
MCSAGGYCLEAVLACCNSLLGPGTPARTLQKSTAAALKLYLLTLPALLQETHS